MAEETIELKSYTFSGGKSATGKKGSGCEVSAKLFGATGINSALHQVVRWQRAKKRSGTHNVLTRAQMTGGGSKPWRQKGTGRARAGSNTSPLWVGGGVAHGPKQRKYDFRINRKERRQALVSAVSCRQAEGRLVVIDDFGLEKCSTKQAATVLAEVGVAKGESALVVLSKNDAILNKSLRNIEGVKVLYADGLNVMSVLNARYLIIAREALSQVENRLSGSTSA